MSESTTFCFLVSRELRQQLDDHAGPKTEQELADVVAELLQRGISCTDISDESMKTKGHVEQLTKRNVALEQQLQTAKMMMISFQRQIQQLVESMHSPEASYQQSGTTEATTNTSTHLGPHRASQVRVGFDLLEQY